MKEKVAQQRVLIFDPERCTGCRYCEIACAFQHYGAINPEMSHIHVFVDERLMEMEATNCQHCEEPICASVCPEDAISKDEEKGWVIINSMKCIGCKSCTLSCPLSCPWLNKEQKIATKCDFCDGEPVCVKYCSSNAIRIGTRAEALEFNRQRYGEGAKDVSRS